jgi:hypothetical protein
MTNPNLDYLPPSGNLMDRLQDEAWWKAAIEAEELIGSGPLAGVPPTGWMKTWPELFTYSRFEQLRSDRPARVYGDVAGPGFGGRP